MIHPETNLQGSEPKKKPKKKKPTGIIKDLMELKVYYMEDRIRGFVEWSDVQAITNKYTNP